MCHAAKTTLLRKGQGLNLCLGHLLRKGQGLNLFIGHLLRKGQGLNLFIGHLRNTTAKVLLCGMWMHNMM